MSRESKVCLAGLGVVACAWIVSAALLSTLPALVSPDIGIRLEMVRSWHSGGSLVRVAHPDPLHPFGFFLARLPTGTFLSFPPLFPLLSTLPYTLAGLPGLVAIPLLSGLLACAVLGAAGRRLGLRSWPLVGPVAGLATALGFYAVVFWDPAPLVLCVSLAALGIARGDARGAAFAGLALGAGAILHETGLLLGAVTIGAGLASRATRRFALAATAAFAAGVALWIVSNQVFYGSFLGAHNQGANELGLSTVARGLAPGALWSRVVSQLGGTPVHAPIHVAAAAFPAALFLASRLAWSRPSALLLVALATGPAISLGAFLRNRAVDGLFTASPLLLLALLAPLWEGQTEEAADAAFAWMARGSLLFGGAALLLPVGPGWGWGSRYLLTSLPFLVLLAARQAEQRWPASPGPRRAASGLLVAGIAGSVLLQAAGTHAQWGGASFWAALKGEVESSGVSSLATDSLAVGPCLVPIGLATPVLYVRWPDLFPALCERLDRDAVDTLGWVGTREGFELLEKELRSAGSHFSEAPERRRGGVRVLVRREASR